MSNLTALIFLLLSSFISSLFSSLSCYVFYKFKKIQENFAARLIFILSLTDFFLWLSLFLATFTKLTLNKSIEENNFNYCVFACILRCVCIILNLSSIFLIGLTLFLEIVFEIKIKKKYENKLIFFFSILSIIIAFIPVFIQAYGIRDGFQCWLMTKTMDFLIFYIPLLFVLLTNIVFIVSVILKLHKRRSIFKNKNLLIKKILFYPSILLITWTPSLVRLFSDIENSVLFAFTYIFMPLQGILNPFVYGQIFQIIKNTDEEPLIQEENVINDTPI